MTNIYRLTAMPSRLVLGALLIIISPTLSAAAPVRLQFTGSVDRIDYGSAWLSTNDVLLGSVLNGGVTWDDAAADVDPDENTGFYPNYTPIGALPLLRIGSLSLYSPDLLFILASQDSNDLSLHLEFEDVYPGISADAVVLNLSSTRTGDSEATILRGFDPAFLTSGSVLIYGSAQYPYQFSATITDVRNVPEPSALLLVGLAGICASAVRRRMRFKKAG